MIPRNFQGSFARIPSVHSDTGTMRTRPIVTTRVGRLGRAEFKALGTMVTVLVAQPTSVARAALAVRRGISLLDLSGGAARARAVDRLAAEAARAAGCPVLLSIGGDISSAGPPPASGWRIRITEDRSGDDVMHLSGGGLATVRSAGDGSTWRSVTVAAGSCQEARSMAATALTRGEAAPQWLTSLGVAARLAGAGGDVIHTGLWSAVDAAA